MSGLGERGASVMSYASVIAIAVALPFVLFMTAGDSSLSELPGEINALVRDFIGGIRG